MIIHERGELEAVINQLSPAQMETPTIPGGWTAKEVMGHITFWEKTLLSDYACLRRGEPVRELNDGAEMDTLNDGVRKKISGMELNRVTEEFQLSGRTFVDWFHTLTVAELERPFMYKMSLVEFIEEVSWKHYREHQEMVTATRELR